MMSFVRSHKIDTELEIAEQINCLMQWAIQKNKQTKNKKNLHTILHGIFQRKQKSINEISTSSVVFYMFWDQRRLSNNVITCYILWVQQ